MYGTDANRTNGRAREQGSAIFYILICVALFAALSYAVANMMRSGANSTDQEQTMLATGDILHFATSLRTAIQQMRIGGVADTEVSFENNIVTGYDNPNCTLPRTDCFVFHPRGGGISYAAPRKEWLDSDHATKPGYGQWYIPEKTCVEGAGAESGNCAGDGVDNEDLVVILPWIKEDICLAINSKMSVGAPGAAPPADADGAWSASNGKFRGVFSDTGSDTDNARLDAGGARSGCIAVDGGFAYFSVLLAR